MAINTYFFNSVSGDRVYDASSMENWLKKLFTSGVYQNDFQVTANNNMSVTVGPGYANIDGKAVISDASVTLDVATASGTLNRIDAVVLRRNDTDRISSIIIVQGSNATTPTVPDLVRTNGIYDIRLAEIYIGAGVIKILPANITDKRADSSVCGWVVGTVKELDVSQMLAQMTAQFGTWFSEMKDQLSTDAAGHLQNEIDEITNKALALQNITIPYASVVANTDALSATFPYCYDYADASITADTVIQDIVAQNVSNQTAYDGYCYGTNQTSAGSVRIYFIAHPTSDMAVTLLRQKGVR